jgi:hypothetical protein
MICSLDFDIIYDSQDPDGAIVNIDLIKQNVEVILDYEKNGKRTLIYYFSKKQGNVKISDIFYQEENRSLKTIIKVSK